MHQKASKMKIIMYYCKAERQGRVKAYAGAPDQKLQGGVYLYSTIVKEVSTDLGYKTKKCLVKSGKDSISSSAIAVYLHPPSQYIFIRHRSIYSSAIAVYIHPPSQYIFIRHRSISSKAEATSCRQEMPFSI